MSEGHDHTHDAVNGSEGAEQDGPHIFLPPAEVLVGKQREEIARLTAENFELKVAAEFQAQVIQMLQGQMRENVVELSKLKEEKETVEAAPARSTKKKTPASSDI